jgi:hypothetical protein
MSARVLTRKRRALALVVLAGVTLATVGSFSLADSGTSTTSIVPESNLPNGKAVDVTTLSSAITRPNGNATIQAGVLVGRVLLTKGYGNRIKLDFAWLDPNSAAQVLNNPNVQIYVALYHPVSKTVSGGCGPISPTVADPFANITDNVPGTGGSAVYCARVDVAASGSLMIAGKLVITKSNVSGFIKSSLNDASAPTCPGSGTTDVWCHPSGLDATQNVLWVAMTIVTPGGKPAGQQNNLNNLSFYSALTTL